MMTSFKWIVQSNINVINVNVWLLCTNIHIKLSVLSILLIVNVIYKLFMYIIIC